MDTNNQLLRVDKSGRLDVFLAGQLTAYTRSFLIRLIREDQVLVNDKQVRKAGFEVKPGDSVLVSFVAFKQTEIVPFDIDLGVQIIHEHPDFLIINKPTGLVVHRPHPLFTQPTLVDWLIASFPHLKEVGLLDRPGIVHRLDKDTSGLMLVARNNFSLAQFGQRFKDRHMHKEYTAFVHGIPPESMTIDAPIGRDPVHKHKMMASAMSIGARNALTHVQLIKQHDGYAQILCKPVTGRTHQIRVHLAHKGYPLVGDSTYGGKQDFIKRHALHAASLAFEYAGQHYRFEAPLADDLLQLRGF